MKLKRLKVPTPSQSTPVSTERTLRVNKEMRIIADDTYFNEVNKWSYYNRIRRLSDEENSLAYADTKISR